MALTFYYASGSPFAWRVWLALEHKGIPYEIRILSFDKGDLEKPEYLALNPRHRVPAIVDDGFALYESAAIVEYLEDRWPGEPRLVAGDVRQRALQRRMVREADAYFAEATPAWRGRSRQRELVESKLGAARRSACRCGKRDHGRSFAGPVRCRFHLCLRSRRSDPGVARSERG
jgi:glutathione S-transferase